MNTELPTPFPKSWWVKPPVLLAGCCPAALDAEACRQKLTALLHAGIRVIINLQQADETNYDGKRFDPYDELLAELATEQGISPPPRCMRYAIPDRGVPTAGEMNAILNAIDAAMDDSKPVYTHCWGGHGRTGTVIGCWLVRHGLTGRRALARITILRQHDPNLQWQPSPQTSEQRDMVMNWADRNV